VGLHARVANLHILCWKVKNLKRILNGYIDGSGSICHGDTVL
jgi:hypothetical protein